MTDTTHAAIHAFFSRYQTVSYKKEETILRPDDPIPYIYFVMNGFVRMYCLLPDGKELTLNIFKPESYFPIFLILAGSPNTYYYQAITAVTCARVPKADVMKFLKDHPDALMELTQRISVGFDGLLSNIQYLLFGSAYSRVASVLKLLSRRFGKKNGTTLTITLPLTHQDIANLIGVTRETTSLEMEKLVARKIISYEHQQVTVRDIAALENEALVEEPESVSGTSL